MYNFHKKEAPLLGLQGSGGGLGFLAPKGARQVYLAVPHGTSPFISIYPWDSGFGTKYANPSTLPPYASQSVAFSPDGADIAVTHVGSPLISVYPWSSGFGTRYANPSTAVTGSQGKAAVFSPDSADIAIGSNGSPYIHVYPWSSGFGTKYSNPSTLPAGYGNSIAFGRA